MTNYYQGLIGILRWIVELGRIDIIVPVTMLSCYLMPPREGHLQQTYHIFAYLKQFNRPMLVFSDAPEPLGHLVSTTCYVDADHAGCQATCRSHTGVLIYVNCAPIIWYSKRLNTVEASTFSSEYIAVKNSN